MRLPFRHKMRKPTIEDLERSRLPKDFWKASLDGISSNSAKELTSKILDRLPRASRERLCVVLRGGFARGKTSISAIILKRMIAWGASVCFVTSCDVLGAVIDGLPFDRDFSLKDRIMDVDLLVIDDLGMEPRTDGVNCVLENVIRNRLSRRLSTIITTNLTEQALNQRYPRIMSVIQGSAFIIDVQGGNKREEKQQEFTSEVGGE